MASNFGQYSIHQEADTIACRNCGKRGKIFWDQVSRAKELVPELIGIEGPFFERLSRKAPHPIELICREYSGVAMAAYPSTSLCGNEKYN